MYSVKGESSIHASPLSEHTSKWVVRYRAPLTGGPHYKTCRASCGQQFVTPHAMVSVECIIQGSKQHYGLSWHLFSGREGVWSLKLKNESRSVKVSQNDYRETFDRYQNHSIHVHQLGE